MHSDGTGEDELTKLSRFLLRLREASIYFTVTTIRDGAILVDIAVPGERWEVEFLDDGSVEVERFVTTFVQGEHALADLFARFSEKKPDEP